MKKLPKNAKQKINLIANSGTMLYGFKDVHSLICENVSFTIGNSENVTEVSLKLVKKMNLMDILLT